MLLCGVIYTYQCKWWHEIERKNINHNLWCNICIYIYETVTMVGAQGLSDSRIILSAEESFKTRQSFEGLWKKIRSVGRTYSEFSVQYNIQIHWTLSSHIANIGQKCVYVICIVV